MKSVDTSTATPTASPPVEPGEMRLEVVVLAVSDVDRAKRFYEGSAGGSMPTSSSTTATGSCR